MDGGAQLLERTDELAVVEASFWQRFLADRGRVRLVVEEQSGLLGVSWRHRPRVPDGYGPFWESLRNTIHHANAIISLVPLLQTRADNVHVCVEVRTSQVRAHEVDVAQVRVAQICTAQIHTAQGAAEQLRVAQVCAPQVRADQVCVDEVRVAQVRVTQVCARKIREQCALQMRASEISAPQSDFGPSAIHESCLDQEADH